MQCSCFRTIPKTLATIKADRSLNVTLFQNGSGPIQLSAIAAGGSQAMLFKINTWGEEAFLDKLKELL